MSIDFALLSHPADEKHLGRIAAQIPGSSKMPGIFKLFEAKPAHLADDDLLIPVPDGSIRRGKMILCSFLPESVVSPRGIADAYQKTRAACKLAKERGAKIAGLGGFTSIVAASQGGALAAEFDLAITSGNTLTAALALEQLYSLAGRLDRDLKNQTVAIVGATGDIGRACALALAPQVKRLRLIARNQNKLEALHDELLQVCSDGFSRPNLEIAADVGEAGIIITATSSPRPVLAESDLRPGTIMCDIGYPHSIAFAPTPRADVMIFAGGLAETPFDLNIGAYTDLPPRVLYGCFSETIALTMAGRYESCSVGQGGITVKRMQTILELARSFGFRPAPAHQFHDLNRTQTPGPRRRTPQS
jgi:predicted amino acid dehydrogenase